MKRKHNKKRFISILLTIQLFLVMMTVPVSAASPAKVELGSTSTFAILSGQSITNTGPTTISGDAGGDIGIYPGSSFVSTGLTTTGTTYLSDSAGVASLAKTDLTTAYIDAAGRTPTMAISGDLGGTTLTPGVYNSATSIGITGTLTLDAQGDPEAVFIFQAGSTLTTATNSEIELINGARYCRIFWQVGSSATLGTTSEFAGHIFAMESITANTGATVQGQLLARNGSVTLDSNTITNGICDTATLHVIKQVINDNAGTAVAADFNLHVKTAGASGIDVSGSPATGNTIGRTYILPVGNYVVSEDPIAGYSASYTGADSSGNVTLASGDIKTVTIINNDIATIPSPATLHVIKQVINDNAGTAVAADFNLHVKTAGVSGSDVSGSPATGNTTGRTYTLPAGNYVVSEDPDAGYSASYTGADSSGNITLAPGEIRTVTITNNDIATIPTPATLHVIKQVINDDAGIAVAADFTLHVKTAGVLGSDVLGSPAPGNTIGRTYTLPAGNYVVIEDPVAGYSSSYIGADSSGNITLAAGEIRTVTITNNDIPATTPPVYDDYNPIYPPLINVVKIPSPMALESGEGLVTYTYEVTNPGLVSLYNVSVTDNKVSEVNYVSGDVNSDDRLQSSETWIYTSSTMLSETTTNMATAKGSANGMTVTDIAYATVVVSSTDYPPLINVVKTPSPLALTSGAGSVTYTYKVTNPGVVELSNVSITDNKVSPLNYVYGDINADNLLQPDETWIYTATTMLSETTTNIVTAIGSANGMTATDRALAVVVVSLPVPVTDTITGGQLPNTSTPWYNILLAGVASVIIGAVVWKTKKRYE